MKQNVLLIVGMLKELREVNDLAVINSTVYDFLAMLECGLISEQYYDWSISELNKIKMEKEKEFDLDVAM